SLPVVFRTRYIAEWVRAAMCLMAALMAAAIPYHAPTSPKPPEPDPPPGVAIVKAARSKLDYYVDPSIKIHKREHDDWVPLKNGEPVEWSEKIGCQFDVNEGYPVFLVNPVPSSNWHVQNPAAEEHEKWLASKVFFGVEGTRNTMFRIMVIIVKDKNASQS